MPTSKRKAPKKPSAAELKRRRMAKAKAGKKPSKAKKTLAKKKITNKEAEALIRKQVRAKKLKLQMKKHMLKNRPGKSGYKAA